MDCSKFYSLFGRPDFPEKLESFLAISLYIVALFVYELELVNVSKYSSVLGSVGCVEEGE